MKIQGHERARRGRSGALCRTPTFEADVLLMFGYVSAVFGHGLQWHTDCHFWRPLKRPAEIEALGVRSVNRIIPANNIPHTDDHRIVLDLLPANVRRHLVVCGPGSRCLARCTTPQKQLSIPNLNFWQR